MTICVYFFSLSYILWYSFCFSVLGIAAVVTNRSSCITLKTFIYTDFYTDVDVFVSDGILCRDVMMLNFFPQLNEFEFSSNHEFVFIIDRSGVYYWTGQSFVTCCFTLR